MVALALNAHKRSDVIETSEGSAAVSQEMRKLLGDMELAKSSIAAFWNASSLNEKLKHVWEADRVAPLMEAYYRHHPLPTAMSEEGPNIRSNRSVSRHSEVPARFVVATVIDSVGLSHDLLLRPKEEGYLIDWEASVGYNASDLSKLINLRHPEPVTLRVNITPASYYNYQYADHRAFQSFAIQVTDPNEPRCYAFAARESEVAKALMRLFANRAQRAVAVTLSMRFPEGGDEGAELLELVKPHWVGE